MPNKILITFLIITKFFCLKVHSNDQIIFDVSEIEILDSGNKVIGKNRGTITLDNGIIIKSDNLSLIHI